MTTDEIINALNLKDMHDVASAIPLVAQRYIGRTLDSIDSLYRQGYISQVDFEAFNYLHQNLTFRYHKNEWAL